LTKLEDNEAPVWSSGFTDWYLEVYEAGYYYLPAFTDPNAGDSHIV